MPFKSVDPKPNFPALEEKILEFWRLDQTFAKSVKARAGGPRFNFYQGPPTANNRAHIGHAITMAFKDIIPRYKTMRGFEVPRKGGWDTHGLPVELEVEKALGIKSKPEIEKYGIAAFNQLCRESVWKYKEEWEKITERIAFWQDMEHAYVTYDNDYIESVWWVLGQIWDRGLLYQDFKVVPYCPRCGTSLSSHEVAQGYAETLDPSVYVKFKLANENNYLLVWTTTPWTLPANVALAVRPDIAYVLAEVKSEAGAKENLIVAKDVLPLFKEVRVLEEFKGESLLGKHYEPLFDAAGSKELAAAGKTRIYEVVAGAFVETHEGTGIVHIAPAYGEEDLELARKEELPVLHFVDRQGRLQRGPDGAVGSFVKQADQPIIADLNTRGLLYQSGEITHTYPFCWRCETPLLYYALTTWFINMQKVKGSLIKHNQKINWLPEHLKAGRFGNFLDEIKDWALTRQRYWGTPFPVWECSKCGERTLIASVKDLKARALAGFTDGLDLHRPAVDEVVVKCDKCAGKAHRVPDLIDVWFDSGSMPYAQWHYPFENKEVFAESYPADYISEAIDQTRGWFYTLLAIATLLNLTEPPYRNVLTLGLGLAEDGRKMSKSKGNAIDPWEAINADGADALRLYLFNFTAPGSPWRISVNLIKETTARTLLTWWNSYSFFVTYANIDGVKVGDLTASETSGALLDEWLDARLRAAGEAAVEALDRYDVSGAGRTLAEFMEDLSNWYIRRSRRRFWKGGSFAADPDKQAAYRTLYHSLTTFARLVAPFTPFFAEELWQNLTGSKESVHLTDYPLLKANPGDKALLEEMKLTREIVALGLAARAKSKHKVRQPLKTVYVIGENLTLGAPLEELILEELNVKEFVQLASGQELPKLSESETAGKLTVAVSTHLDSELIGQGAVRELTRAIQSLRKQSGLAVTDRIILTLSAGKKVAKLIEAHGEEIKQETLCDELTLVHKLPSAAGELKLLTEHVKINLAKI